MNLQYNQSSEQYQDKTVTIDSGIILKLKIEHTAISNHSNTLKQIQTPTSSLSPPV
ncbi:hypothetical protein Pan161_53730 [Gimesia algae]|uniref:Uncharacterized protein n=1 Tax=Gimesia algae TaxID=2527971 RepID=A0A517VL57_9PLAN|nr:hypothetical protein Pan161_53730 [Gimesia algae]